MTADEIYHDFTVEFGRRKFVGGLLPAIIDFLLELGVPEHGITSFDGLLQQYPQQDLTAAGKRANTLIVQRPGGSTLSIRPFYNRLQQYYQAEKHRHDFPTCAPHATQAWTDYEDWIDSLTRLGREELRRLRERAVQYVLDQLPDRAFDPSTTRSEPAVFRMLLEGFDFKAPQHEPTGAAYQGAVFGFVRADNPHLQVEIDRVRTGSSRRQRIGDIDAWEGERLAVTAEVKFRALDEEDVADLSNFINEANRRSAIGLVVATDFTDAARDAFRSEGMKPLGLEDLIRIVELWDPAKQRIAVTSFVYYAEHVEKNSVLADRVGKFLDSLEEEHDK